MLNNNKINVCFRKAWAKRHRLCKNIKVLRAIVIIMDTRDEFSLKFTYYSYKIF